MPIDQNYHTDFTRISNTMLKHFKDDKRKFWSWYINMDRGVPNLMGKTNVAIGQVVHQIMLEKIEASELLAYYPQDCFKVNGTLNPKPAKEFRESMQAQGKIVVKDEEFKRIMEICNSIEAHPLGQILGREGTTFEEPIFWTDNNTGIDCRACPDFAFNTGSEVLCYDLKVTEKPDPKNWAKIARRFAYYQQDAHYSSGLAHVTGLPVRFVFWAVESVWPYRVAQYEYDPISRERAGEDYMRTLQELKRCKEQDDWQDAWTTNPNFLAVEPWDVEAEDELEGFDD